MNTDQALLTLNVISDASFDDVKYAYRKLALELHPDKNTDESDGKKFTQITEAYHFLKNNKKKLNATKRKPQEAWKYTDSKTKKDTTFKRPKWGASPDENPPEQDWGKYTREFEEAAPEFWNDYKKQFWENYEARINPKGGIGKEYRKPKKEEPDFDLSVKVDPSLCIGCCSCEMIAPEVFTIDKTTKMNPKSHVHNEKGTGYNKVMNAAETCPTKAINVTDKDTRRILFPW